MIPSLSPRQVCTIASRVLLLALLGALAGCAAQPPASPAAASAPEQAAEAPNSGALAAPPGESPYQRLQAPTNGDESLVYGYLDLSEAPSPLGWVKFHQVSPVTSKSDYWMRVDGGVFYMEKFPPGIYVLGQFGGRRADGTNLAYNLPRSSPVLHIAIHEPGLHFVGAYKYQPVMENGQDTGRFHIEKLAKPSEADVLRRILPHARGTPWVERIQARLKATGGGRGQPVGRHS